MDEIDLSFKFCLSVAECKMVLADQLLRYNLHIVERLGKEAAKDSVLPSL